MKIVQDVINSFYEVNENGIEDETFGNEIVDLIHKQYILRYDVWLMRYRKWVLQRIW